MKRPLFSLLSLLLLVCTLSVQAQTPADWEQLPLDLNFYMVNDMGRNGYYDQKPIAELMGQMADAISPECVFAIGDVHHFWGVESTQDPLWTTNYELIYSHPDLMLPWYPVLGNHEYRGNTEAILDYSHVSRRWMMPARYYSRVFTADSFSIRFILIDTSPLIERYRAESEKYPDACKQDWQAELDWLDQELAQAGEDWIVVMGHHPIYAETGKTEYERLDMQKYVDSILRKHRVDIYASGHIHNFQHLRAPGSDIDYIVNSAAALSRPVSPVEGTQFCDPRTGFSIISASRDTLNFYMIDATGTVINTVTRTK